MTGRRDRIARVAKMASETEELARARWAEANQRVNAVDRQRQTSLDRAGHLAGVDIPLGLRTHLVGAGARHLVSLADRKSELLDEAAARQVELKEAASKVKSLERMVERLDRAEADRRDQRELADLQDIVAIRAARDKAVGGTR